MNIGFILATSGANREGFPLANESVHAIVTSVPYLWKRDYGVPPTYWGGEVNCWHEWEPQPIPIAHKPMSAVCQKCGCWFGSLGLEPSPEQYVVNLRLFFRECYRVLHPSGQLFINIDDSRHPKLREWLGLPIMLAQMLREDGWRWEDQIIWHVPNRMPNGGVHSRFTHTYETVLMLNKSRYAYFDVEANRQPYAAKTLTTYGTVRGARRDDEGGMTLVAGVGKRPHFRAPLVRDGSLMGAALRNVWSIAHRANGSDRHTAAFPPDLVRHCILAATSEVGVCSHCGAPWQRVMQRVDHGFVDRHVRTPHNDSMGGKNGVVGLGSTLCRAIEYQELGWRPTCDCPEHQPVPALVLDPFSGTGTTVRAARELGRRGIGFDLSPEFLVESVAIYQRQLTAVVEEEEETGVDEFNRSLMQAAYQSLVRGGKVKELTAQHLRSEMFSMWVAYRNALIQQWAADMIEETDRQTLIDQYNDDLIEQVGELLPFYEWPDEDDPDSVAYWVAHHLACVRWVELENAGKADMVRVTEADATAYIEMAQAYVPVKKVPIAQMPLFGMALV